MSDSAQSLDDSARIAFWSEDEISLRHSAIELIAKKLGSLVGSLANLATYNDLPFGVASVQMRLDELHSVSQRLAEHNPFHKDSMAIYHAFRLKALNGILVHLDRVLIDGDGFEEDESLGQIESIFTEIADELVYVPDRLRDADRPSGLSIQNNLTEMASLAATIAQQLKLREAISRSQAAVRVAEESAKHVQEVAGEAAEGGLAIHFHDYADSQRVRADYLRYAAIGVVLAATTVVVVLFAVSTSKLTWAELVQKSAISIPGAALAAYLARESSRDRSRAHWAESIGVQLRTLNAFTDSLDDELKHEIRGEFGKRIFGESLNPSMGGSTDVESYFKSGDIDVEKVIKVIGVLTGTDRNKSR